MPCCVHLDDNMRWVGEMTENGRHAVGAITDLRAIPLWQLEIIALDSGSEYQQASDAWDDGMVLERRLADGTILLLCPTDTLDDTHITDALGRVTC